MIRRSIVFVLIIFLFGCNNDKARQSVVKKKHSVSQLKTISNKAVSSDTLVRYTGPNDTVPKVIIPAGTMEVVTDNQPADTVSSPDFLLETFLRKDDINAETMKRSWKGLFWRKDGTAYIKDTKLTFEQTESETDEEGQKTGWVIKSDNKDHGFFLSGISYLTDGPVQMVNIAKPTLYPGEKQVFTYNGVDYVIYAKGFKKDGDIYNYKLFLFAKIKGHYFNQLLASEQHFGDEMHWESDAIISVDFAGDIDGDKIPDFVISRWAEFSGSSELFLSKPAGDSAILKHVTGFGTSD